MSLSSLKSPPKQLLMQSFNKDPADLKFDGEEVGERRELAYTAANEGSADLCCTPPCTVLSHEYLAMDVNAGTTFFSGVGIELFSNPTWGLGASGWEELRLIDYLSPLLVYGLTCIAPKPPLPFLKFLRSSTKPFWAEGSLFSLQEDTGLQGNQDSRVGSISALAQLAWQPFFYMADRASHECHTES
ncbi:hypothetical protein RJ035_004472 [Blastomyces gilchristii]